MISCRMLECSEVEDLIQTGFHMETSLWWHAWLFCTGIGATEGTLLSLLPYEPDHGAG